MGPGDPFVERRQVAVEPPERLSLSEANRALRSPRGAMLSGAFVVGALFVACTMAVGLWSALAIVGGGLVAVAIVWLVEAALTGRFQFRDAYRVLVGRR